MTPSRGPSSPRGRWVVLALVALGLLAGVLSVAYWTGVIRRTWPAGGPPASASAGTIQQGAGAAAWDPKRAEAEMQELADRIARSGGPDRDRAAILAAAQRLADRYPRYA